MCADVKTSGCIRGNIPCLVHSSDIERIDPGANILKRITPITILKKIIQLVAVAFPCAPAVETVLVARVSKGLINFE